MNRSRELFDSPRDLALLRMVAKDPQHWKRASDVRSALAWVDVPLDAGAWRRLLAMEQADLIEGRKAKGPDGSGREWRLKGSMADIKRATGGIDVLRIDAEEAKLVADDATPRRVEFQPDAYLAAPTPEKKARRALRQCPSPWELARRLSRINWIHPELAA